MQHTDTPQRLDVLDGLRGLAVALVVWYHLWLVSGFVFPLSQPLQLFVESGFLGVDIFFFVSGFCICLPYARAHAARRRLPSWREFARKRALKIVPSYVLALLVFAALYHAKFSSAGDLVTSVIAHALFVHVWFPQTFGSISGPLWTIGVEVQFYVLFALVARFAVRKPVATYVAFAVVAECYRAFVAASGNDADFGAINQLPAVLDVFGAGMLAACAFCAIASARAGDGAGDESLLGRLARALGGARSQPERELRALQASGIALVALAVATAGFGTITLVGRLEGSDGVHRLLDASRFAFGPLLALLTLGVVLGTKPLHDAVAPRPLRELSLVSYNAYLWNLEIAVTLQAIGLPPWAIFVFGAILTGCVAVAVTYGFEQPIVRDGLAGLRNVGGRIRARVATLVVPRPAAKRYGPARAE